MRRDHRAGGFSALLAASLAVCLAAGLAAGLAAPTALAQTAPTPAPDVLPDVTVFGNLPAEPDVMASRLSRFVYSRCFIRPSVHNRDPTAIFNRAYYAELTGQPDYYDTLLAKEEPRKARYRYPPAIHSDVFKNMTGPRLAPGTQPIMDSYGPAGSSSGDSLGCGAPGLLRAAEKNTTFARALALYDKGQHAQALTLFKQSRDELGRLGLGAEAALMISKIYLAGQGVPADTAEAIDWLKKASASRPLSLSGTRPRYDPRNPGRFFTAEAEAAFLLGRIYFLGLGVAKNPTQARAWFESAWRVDHVPAAKILGDMRHAGYGGDQSYRRALVLYSEAGAVGHGGAKYEAGGMYDLGEGVRADRKKALLLYREASSLGEGRAAYALAVAYDTGAGLPADPKLALAFYTDAAIKGSAQAQTALGTYFYEGGSELGHDPGQARAWFTEAAIGGDPDGMVNLAAMLVKGEGGEADLVRAWAWLTIARDGGREDVTAGLAALEGRMTGDELAEAKALIAPDA